MPQAKTPPPQGKPCWTDLMTPDQDAALAFYGELLGWTARKTGPEFGGYAVMHVGDDAVAGIGPRMPGAPAAPPAWTVYFATDDVDAAARRVTVHGGEVLFGPHDIEGTGRTATVADPSSAVFGLWQPAPFPGFALADEPGAAVWFELDSRQGPDAAAFYGSVLGAAVAPMDQIPDAYWLVTVEDTQVAGIWKDPEATAPRWRVFFEVPDADAAVATATARGGTVLRPAHDSPYGRLAGLTDPQGAEFVVLARNS